jgi:hypothetical protein
MKIRWRLYFRAVHRDLGYFFFGLTVVYAVSGIALNHRDKWNPSYTIRTFTLQVDPVPEGRLSSEEAHQLLVEHGLGVGFKRHYEPTPQSIRFFFRDSSATLDRASGELFVEEVRRRPILHTWNTLHYNPGRWWTWFADIFSVGLIIVAVTGLFILRGRNSITRRGGILVTLGILLPTFLVVVYL